MLHRLIKPVIADLQRDLEEKILLLGARIQAARGVVEGGPVVAVELTPKGEAFSESEVTALRLLIDRLSEEFFLQGKKIAYQVIFESSVDVGRHPDPHPALYASREVVETAPGSFLYQGVFKELLDELDRRLARRFIEAGCVDQKYPLLVDTRSLFGFNYFETMGHHLFFPAGLQGGYEPIAGFARRNSSRANPERMLKVEAGEMEFPPFILSPTVCFHCFAGLKNAVVSREGAQFTAINACLRNERSALVGLERLQCFSMREAVVVGSREWVAERFDALLAFSREFYGDELGLKFRVRTANDPFFGTVGTQMQIFQSAQSLKYEIQVYLPYADRYVACGSVNNHLNSMSRAFGFRLDDGGEAFSACMGVGYDRLALALLAQSGETPAELLARLRGRDA